MCTDNLKKLSIPALAVLLLMAAASQAMLIHYWPFNLPNPLRNEGRGGAGFPPHDARLVDFHPLYVPPTLVAGRLGRAYDLGTGQNSNILVGGNNISGYTTAHMDGTLPGTPITVSLWFRPHALPDQAVRQFLFSNMQSGGNQDRFFITLFTPNIEGAPSGVTFSVGNTHDFEWHLTPPASHTVVPGTWNHVMMSVRHLGWGQGSQVVYTLNGGPARTVTANTLFNPPVFDRSNKRIGTNGNTLETGKTARAIFDDMAIWSEILPQGATGFNAAQFIWNGGAGRPANVACGRVGYDPIPADKSVGNAGLTQLQWSNSLRLAHRVDVYFSTSLDDLIQLQDAGNPAVNRNIPLTPAGRRIATNLAVTPGSLSTLPITLPAGEDFYWRVDTRSSNPADPNTYHGPVWKFSAGNAPPQVNAGNDIFRHLSGGTATINLSGTATDDGLPVGAPVTCQWRGPDGTPLTTTVVRSGNVYTCTAQHSQTQIGSYTYTLTAGDTTGENSDDVLVTVLETPCLAAQANPMYYMGIRNVSDINDDCFVTFRDFALAVNTWQVCTALDAVCN